MQALPFSRFTRYFIEVNKHGSIRKAAEAIHTSPSAIDRQLLTAEEALGVPLFERLPSGLRLTAAGELLLASVRNWTKDYDRMTGQIDDLVGLRRGHVHIAVVDALSKGFVPRAITAMRQEYLYSQTSSSQPIRIIECQSIANDIYDKSLAGRSIDQHVVCFRQRSDSAIEGSGEGADIATRP